MIQNTTPLLYANRLKETRKVFLSEDQKLFYEVGLDNAFYKSVYAYILCNHFGIECPEIKRIEKDKLITYCQQTFSDWEEFDSTRNFSFQNKKSVQKLQNPIRIIRLALFDEQFMVTRKRSEGYNLAIIHQEKERIISKDFFRILDSNYNKTDSIQKAYFYRNILTHFSLEEIIQEIEDYFSLQDALIEEKILLLSAYLKESKYKELYMSFINNTSRNEAIKNQFLKNVYLLKR